MPKRAKGLTKAFVKRVREPGRYSDGRGMHLFVSKAGTKSWVQRITIDGKRRDMGLGPADLVTLEEARDKAIDNLRAARGSAEHIPKAIRELADAPKAIRRRSAAPTFAEAAEAVISLHSANWKAGSSTEAQWRSSLANYAMPRLGKLPVDSISAADVMACLEPVWTAKPAVGKMLKQRISTICDWCVAQGHRSDNPIAGVDAALPRPKSKVKHRQALPHGEVAAALGKVDASGSGESVKRVLRFQTLTAVRPGEARAAKWDEIDMAGGTWTIPGERMKIDAEHRVPLSTQALAVLEDAREATGGEGLVFPSQSGKTLAPNTVGKALKDQGVDAVPHGFRSSFRDWCGEAGKARELAEAALAHRTGNAVEAAYARSDLFERRRVLMQAWADYLDS